ncbi:DUF2344 domain-containing protein [Thermanaerosceptrum fracticalcis]|uniref:DUF2344 domain-containing protein n=1 Tax=Thermanaerosceptrum fracticalcis TaxID=1712410 RepID=A0A7G6DZ08_THEFR|nr:TIGR03936 family radical SAM-associated protein [Thermanaerosceptrum fracticalcis]QNB45062.1 DUF2344 domain-containing protein [Thermanaerosceptrum fracticalcis]
MLLRVKYAKTPEGRFLSHLDMARTMERAFRRARLPLAFSEGFNPHPKFSFGSALAVGVTSEGEYLDIELREDLPVEEVRSRLEAALPPGLKLLEMKKLENRGESLTAQINMARYILAIPLLQTVSREQLDEAIAAILAQSAFTITRQGKKGPREVNIREGIFDLKGKVEDNIVLLEMDLQTGSEGNVKPDEVLQMLRDKGNIPLAPIVRIHRQGLFIRKDDRIKTPMEE